eukprot:1483665-Rhodomonas_salina.1
MPTKVADAADDKDIVLRIETQAGGKVWFLRSNASHIQQHLSDPLIRVAQLLERLRDSRIPCLKDRPGQRDDFAVRETLADQLVDPIPCFRVFDRLVEIHH